MRPEKDVVSKRDDSVCEELFIQRLGEARCQWGLTGEFDEVILAYGISGGEFGISTSWASTRRENCFGVGI